MIYGTKTGYSLTWKTNISQAGLSFNERGRRARHVPFPSHGYYSRWRTASTIKNQFQDQLRLGQVITGSGCNSLKRFEKECVGKCHDLSMFHYSRGIYGPRIDLFLRLLPLAVLTPFPLSLCDTWPERKKPSPTCLGYKKEKWLHWKSVSAPYKELDGLLR